MQQASLEQALINGKRICNPIQNCKPRQQAGYYSIWLKEGKKLPSEFDNELKRRGTRLLYLGRAKDSLFTRLLEQELQHKNPATFFRSIGAVLGYRPTKSSLVGKKNQNNYKFSVQDTKAIISWIDENLEVMFVESEMISSFEETMIAKYSPILNWSHSQMKFLPLKILKDECRLIARN